MEVVFCRETYKSCSFPTDRGSSYVPVRLRRQPTVKMKLSCLTLLSIPATVVSEEIHMVNCARSGQQNYAYSLILVCYLCLYFWIYVLIATHSNTIHHIHQQITTAMLMRPRYSGRLDNGKDIGLSITLAGFRLTWLIVADAQSSSRPNFSRVG